MKNFPAALANKEEIIQSLRSRWYNRISYNTELIYTISAGKYFSCLEQVKIVRTGQVVDKMLITYVWKS